MTSRHSIVEAAERTLVREASFVISGNSPINPSLEKAVRDLTRLMRENGDPPESVLVAVKVAAFKAGAGPFHDDVRPDKKTSAEMMARMVTWCVDSYYSSDAVHRAEPHTSEPQPQLRLSR